VVEYDSCFNSIKFRSALFYLNFSVRQLESIRGKSGEIETLLSGTRKFTGMTKKSPYGENLLGIPQSKQESHYSAISSRLPVMQIIDQDKTYDIMEQSEVSEIDKEEYKDKVKEKENVNQFIEDFGAPLSTLEPTLSSLLW
jgi:hypothetical protein